MPARRFFGRLVLLLTMASSLGADVEKVVADAQGIT
jgi:hypothetical protein